MVAKTTIFALLNCSINWFLVLHVHDVYLICWMAQETGMALSASLRGKKSVAGTGSRVRLAAAGTQPLE